MTNQYERDLFAATPVVRGIAEGLLTGPRESIPSFVNRLLQSRSNHTGVGAAYALIASWDLDTAATAVPSIFGPAPTQSDAWRGWHPQRGRLFRAGGPLDNLRAALERRRDPTSWRP